MKRFASFINPRISRTLSLFYLLLSFLIIGYSSSPMVAAVDDLHDLPVPLFSGWGIWDITRACANDNCNGPRDTIGKKICCIETIVEQILQITCNTQSLVENLQEQINTLQSCQDEVCLQNEIDSSLVEEIISLADDINAKICEIETKTEIIDNASISILENISNVPVLEKSKLDLAIAILNQSQINLSIIDLVQLLENSALSQLFLSQTIESFIHDTLSLCDITIQSSIGLENSVIPKLITEDSILDALLPKFINIFTKLEALEPCSAIPISQPTLISSAGIYCLTSDIAGQITVAANNVDISMNGHRVFGGINGIAIQPNSVDITIIGPGSIGPVTNAGILFSNNNNSIIVSDVQATTALVGFLTNGINTSLQFNRCSADTCLIGFNLINTQVGQLNACEMVSNGTGLLLQDTNQIIIENCIASNNSINGFSQETSDVSTFINCKAYNNGIGSTGNSFGFVSSNGSSNIFENCLADGTSTLTTNVNAVAAGFALIGNEMCSKILGCESVNTFAPSPSTITTGAVPYGILLQSTLVNNGPTLNTTITSNLFSDPNKVAWSPDGKYLAVANSSNNTVSVFDVTNINAPVAYDPIPTQGLSPIDVAWSPNSNYLAVINFASSTLVTFNVTNPASPIASSPVSTEGINAAALAWSPNGKYIAALNFGSSTLVTFNVSDPSNPIAYSPVSTGSSAGTISVTWSPDSTYIAVVNRTTNQLVTFNATNPAVPVANTPVSTGVGSSPSSVVWSPNGNYLAIVNFDLNTLTTFNVINPATPIASSPISTSGINPVSVTWSPDSKYLAVVNTRAESSNLVTFNATNPAALTFISNVASGGVNPISVVWSPDGKYIAALNIGTPNLVIFNILNFPSSNVIKDNITYCNTNASSAFPKGIGISGSSTANLIINNSAYNNNAFNYQFVTNVFNQLFNSVPTELQNIAIRSQEAIINPPQISEQLNCIQATVNNVTAVNNNLSNLDSLLNNNFGTLNSLSDSLIAKQSVLESLLLPVTGIPCAEIALANTSSFTISSAGIYCLANNVTGNITISASNVTLDLNGHHVINTTGNAITINTGLNHINILNGRVEGNTGDGILVNSGVSQINITDIIANNSIRGIHLIDTNNATILHCDMSSNTTGLEVTTSTNVRVDSSQATTNVNTGFSLISSATNVISGCKALNNGLTSMGNSYGYISSNGNSNIFTNCIADGTTTTTTNFNALVAGFALTNSEMCSQIVNCESGNNTAPFTISTTSTTVIIAPTAYGILLQGTLNQLVNPANTVSFGNPSVINSLNWTSDGRYLAVTGGSGLLQIFQFNTSKGLFTLVSSIATNYVNGFSVNWSPNDQYLAAGGSVAGVNPSPIRIYRFNTSTNSLSLLNQSSTYPLNTIGGVNWSSDGNYLLVGGRGGTPAPIQAYRFNPNNASLTLIGTPPNYASGTTGINALHWSPNGQYVVVGGLGVTPAIEIYKFAPDTGLTLVSSASYPNSPLRTVKWSPNSNFVAVGGGTTGAQPIQVYRFDQSVNTMTLLGTSANYPSIINTLDWSADGKYLAVGGSVIGSNPLQVYQFNPNNNGPLMLITSINNAASISSINWGPDGTYIATGALNIISPYSGIQFPTNNIIKNNIVYCNTGGTTTQPYGVGLSGSSIANLIVNNLSYNNNLFNYVFVTNVFNQLLYGTNIPSPLQNISLAGNTPITQPINIYNEIAILEPEAVRLNSMIDLVLSLLP